MRGPTGDNVTLTDEDVRTVAIERLQACLPVHADGWRADTVMVLDVMLEAAVTGRSIEAVCDDLEAVADANTIRGVINEQIKADGLGDLERAMNEAVAFEIPHKVRFQARDIALDLHDQPFYGKTPKLVAFACRGEARDGTTYFYRVATAYVMLDGLRVTLAVLFVRPGDALVDILAELLRRVRLLGVRIKRLWLDKGFANTAIYRYLETVGTPAVIACPIRGKTGGTRGLCKGRRSYTTHHTFRSQQYGAHTAQVVIARTFTTGPRQRRRARWLVFVQINGALPPHQVRKLYRRRFGIESSYRTMRQVRLRTNSRNPALRFVYMALGFVLVNIWIALRFAYCQIPRRGRGGRPLDDERFKLHCLASFIRHAVERRYGLTHEIQATAWPIGL